MEEKKESTREEEIRQLGRGNFRIGLNCCESAFKACMDSGEFGPCSDDMICMASGFGGGLGGKRQLCGAVIGAAMGLGLKKGRRDPLATEDFEERLEQLNGEGGIYDQFKAYAEEIEAEYGALTCGELIKYWDERDEMHSYDRKKFCQNLIGFCCKTAYKHANK
ncbi:MAG: C_GCAxxG_C_C family protein [Lachnospiraceae bacterium]|nr:C_GCAxxG_C_C family protein [Lachnospiraceae bacterium]